jgi:hypothetical protein
MTRESADSFGYVMNGSYLYYAWTKKLKNAPLYLIDVRLKAITAIEKRQFVSRTLTIMIIKSLAYRYN